VLLVENKMKNYFVFIFIICFLSVSYLFAQEADTLEFWGEEIQIVAAKIVAVQGDVSLPIQVITQKDIRDNKDFPVLDLLDRKIPGLSVTRKGVAGYGVASGSAGAISMRGIGGKPNTGVLVLIDGRPEFMGMMGHPLPDVYLSSQIEKIEVIKGPASTLFGSNAMGGVINIITKKRFEEGMSTSFESRYGSYNTMQNVLINEGRKDNFFYTVNFSNIKTDGERTYSEYKNSSLSLKLGYELNKNYEIILSGNHTEFKIYDPGLETNPVIDHWYNIERNWFNLSFNNQNNRLNGEIRVHGNTGYHKIYDGWRSNDGTYGLIMYQHLRLNNATVTFGFDYKRYGGTGKNITADKNYGTHYIYEYAPYLNFQYFTGDWILNTGYRVEKNKVYGNENAPKFGIVRKINKGNITLNVCKGYRSPTIRELYLFPAPNPELKPENAWNKEIAFNYQYSNFGKIIMSIFELKGTNFIQTFGSYPNLRLENSGSFTHRGVEFALSGLHYNGFTNDLTFCRLDVGDNTANIPEYKLNLTIQKNFGRFSSLLSFQKVWNYYGANKKQQRLNDYLYSKINVRYTPYKNINLFGIIDNVFNESYQIITGYPMPGRHFYMGFETTF